jgi:carbamoyl-phosphate synthase large subunit
VLIEESVLGWGEFELEVMRDHADNAVIVCSIENVDPMGVHTGDSVTRRAAAEPQRRDLPAAARPGDGGDPRDRRRDRRLERAVRGQPATQEIVVIEMNPRVSRSSALASKATGFPIAKIAARLAVGYTLEEIPNDITRATPASFEPTIDYVVVKWPRFAFEKFLGAEPMLTTHMKSVGEAMAIGRTFAGVPQGDALARARRAARRRSCRLASCCARRASGCESLRRAAGSAAPRRQRRSAARATSIDPGS